MSNGGDNYFPTIACDSEGNRLVAGWFTNQFDGDFHNRSAVELVRLNDDGNGQVQPTACEAVERARGRPAPGWILHWRLHRGVRARPDGVGRLQRELPVTCSCCSSPNPAAGQTTWPRCGCSRRLARSRMGPRGLHPSLAADGVNARGGLRQPEGAGRYGVRPPSSSAPLGIRRCQAWNRSTSRTDPIRDGLPRNPYG